jgi:hypothetical protein
MEPTVSVKPLVGLDFKLLALFCSLTSKYKHVTTSHIHPSLFDSKAATYEDTAKLLQVLRVVLELTIRVDPLMGLYSDGSFQHSTQMALG